MSNVEVKGFWPDEALPLVDTFADNFVRGGEEGAALAVYRNGQPWISLWAGVRRNKDAEIGDTPWTENTLVNVFSASKGLVALRCLQRLEQAQLSLDTPVAEVWSEFAQQGKGGITIGQILCHRAGLSAFHERRADSDIFDWPGITQAVAAETPWWEPGSEQGYSPFIFGWIVGELARRLAPAESFGEDFRWLTDSLGADCHFGLRDDELPRVADTGPLKTSLQTLVGGEQGADSAYLGRLMKADPRGVTNRAFANPMSLMISSNSRAWRQAQIPAANGHCSARGLATIYGALVSGELLSEQSRSLCWTPLSQGQDRVLGVPLRFGAGFMLTQDRQDCRFGSSPRAFGHPGAGGSLGFADPDKGLGFGYVTSRMGQSLLIDARAIRLIEALYSLPELAQ